MIINPILIFFTFFLIGISILDYKYKAIPSTVLTAMIFILLFIKFDNLQWALILGALGLMLWELAYENESSFGMADVKVMVMLGFFISNLALMSVFLIIFSFGQLIYLIVMRQFFKSSQEVPFIPFFLGLWLGGLFGGLWI